ncbi:MAG: ABC transporter substrate-binding protein, partial [Candidatus Izemoplasmatales bacterium]|nr:ABC transporter substrate-binding protein [Candidatus Izemoplasmatales bacterium]
MLKKLLIPIILMFSALLMVACQEKTAIVSFDSQGGTAIGAISVKVGELVEEPTDPTKASTSEDLAWNFTGWYTSATATDATLFDFSTEITADITLYAGWTQNIVVRFNTKTSSSVASSYLPIGGGSVTKPTDPTRTGFTFGGWFYGKPGATWLEPTAVTFPLTVTGATQLYAYWIPVDSAAISWSDGETYKNSFTELTADPILNPLTYHWSHEDSLMNYMKTPLYGTDVDWAQAIADGLATTAGDFSTIDESNIGALLRQNVLYGAAQFPIAVGGEFDGEDGTDQNGKYSEAISREISAYTYRYTLNPDVYWEDGTHVTANDYYYTYFQYIDPVQNNYRASSYYPSADRSTGTRIVGARAYFLQGTEIGLGESDGELAGDYGYVALTKYIGENTTAYPQYIGTWPFAGSDTFYLSLDDYNALGLTLGTNQAYPEGLDYGASTIAKYDFRVDVALNPYYAGDAGTTWPTVSESTVGFKVIDDYTFEITYEVPISHSSSMANANFTLVNPTVYEASLDAAGTNSTYGTSQTPAVSYGAYLLKSWDTNQKMVFNKNYNSIMQLYYNYKSISFEFYPNTDSRMQAFEAGLLSSTGLNQTYYAQYLENPNLKSFYNGYPQYLLFNTEAYDTQNPAVVSAIQDVDFRQAFFFGFNRLEYASTIYAPNVPTLLVYSTNATQYDNDEAWYVNTPEYAQMLTDLGIDQTTYGYDPVKAVELFNTAYAAWTALGNTGPITLDYLTSDGAESERIDAYIINHFVTLFGSDKIAFTRHSYATDVSSDKQDSHEFDITLTGVGTGSVTNLSVMLPILGLFFQDVYGDQFGFNTPTDLAIPDEAFVILEENKIDLRNTWNYLKTVTDRFDETTDNGSLWDFWLILEANEGYYVGNLDTLFQFGLDCTFIWAGLAPQYDGDVADRNAVTRAFDAIILEYAPLVPTAGRASAIVYASNVVCEWPAYHNIM